MPAYSFKERFVPFVKDGSKRSTIRAFRKDPPRVGQTAHCFFGMRTKYCMKLRDDEPKITAASCILITKGEKVVMMDTNWLTEPQRARVIETGRAPKGVSSLTLTAEQKDDLAWSDGFRHADRPFDKAGCFKLMVSFWTDTHSLPFVGNYITWQPLKIS